MSTELVEQLGATTATANVSAEALDAAYRQAGVSGSAGRVAADLAGVNGVPTAADQIDDFGVSAEPAQTAQSNRSAAAPQVSDISEPAATSEQVKRSAEPPLPLPTGGPAP